jgi:hypothetical protein
MRLEDGRRKPKKNKKSLLVSVRITEREREWLRKKNLSPSVIWSQALRELGYIEEEQ